jgi:DNA-binding response OmpR family regulator
MQKLLSMEGNNKLAVIIRHYLLNDGLDAIIASNGSEALVTSSQTDYDIQFIDIRSLQQCMVMCWQWVRERRTGKDTPIIRMIGVSQSLD